MEHRTLGRSGVAVSRVVLGCGNFGGIGSSPAFFGQGTPRETATALMDGAWELGITTFDTADAYGGGRSETWIGEWLQTKPAEVRDRLALQTKTYNPMDAGADKGLGRRRILRQIDTSLTRLGVEQVAVYMAHDFDPAVPQEDTLLAFDEILRSGKIGAAGASNFTAEQLAEALELSEIEGLARYEVVQNSFSLLEASDTETVLPVCREHVVSYQAFSPLAGGWLTGKYGRETPPPAGSRMSQRPEPYEGYRTDRVWTSLENLRTRAGLLGVSMAGLALASLLHRPDVSSVVVGPNRVEHLGQIEEALTLKLSPAEVAEIEGLFR